MTFVNALPSAKMFASQTRQKKENIVKNLHLSLLLLLVTLVCLPALATPTTQETEQKEAHKAHAKVAKAEGSEFKTAKGTLTGTLSVVDADKGFIALKDSSGTSFGFKVKRTTKIKIGGQPAKLADLASATNKQATVNYLSLRTGNVAQSVEVGP
jgi:hypothetical protein